MLILGVLLLDDDGDWAGGRALELRGGTVDLTVIVAGVKVPVYEIVRHMWTSGVKKRRQE